VLKASLTVVYCFTPTIRRTTPALASEGFATIASGNPAALKASRKVAACGGIDAVELTMIPHPRGLPPAYTAWLTPEVCHPPALRSLSNYSANATPSASPITQVISTTPLEPARLSASMSFSPLIRPMLLGSILRSRAAAAASAFAAFSSACAARSRCSSASRSSFAARSLAAAASDSAVAVPLAAPAACALASAARASAREVATRNSSWIRVRSASRC